MSKISNAILMVQLLSNNRKYSVKELSEQLEVTPRMVRVYKEELEKAGIYIDSIRGPYGGYVLNQSIKMPNINFSANDVNLLNIVNDTISDQDIKDNLILLVDKIKSNCFTNYKDNTVSYLKEDTLSKYNMISKAIKEKRKVKIIYYSYDTGENERVIHPYGLFLYNTGWYVSAFCEKKEQVRSFELVRINSCELLKEIFE